MLANTYTGHTSVVVVRSDTGILIGADSKTGGGANLSCKIQQVDSVFYSASGLVYGPTTGFNIFNIALEALSSQGDIVDRVVRFEEMLLPSLTNTVQYLRDKEPANFQKMFVKTNEGPSIVFCGIKDNVPMVYWRTFNVSVSKQGDTEITIVKRGCPEDCPPSKTTYFLLGEFQAIGAFMVQHPDFLFLTLKDTIERIPFLIQLEIASRPDIIGPPIDLLLIGKDGAHWIQKKPECPEIQP